jgi:predicted Rossmann fold flavoprotein
MSASAANSPSRYDVVIIGGGAAGLMCAIEAGKRGRRVIVIEHAPKLGKKILISGGGRCNFTNIHTKPENFISANPHFAKSALARYTPANFIALVQKHRIKYHEKTLGQLFCDTSAREIVQLLEDECQRAHVEISLNTRVHSVRRDDQFVIETSQGEFRGSALVIATGGLSIPKMGATSFGYDIARQFGLRIVPTYAALVPLTLSDADHQRYCDLTGIATEVVASIGSTRFRERMLITHRGLSGPAILQISSYWHKPEAITLDIAPDTDLTAPIRASSAHRDLAAAKSAFRTKLPARLADRWLEHNAPRDWTNHSLAELERHAHHWQIIPSGTEGYEKAEVTAGGVDTDELSAKTMESRRVPGLYFIGEVVDVTGHLGGFNFQWGWASGFVAGQAV